MHVSVSLSAFLLVEVVFSLSPYSRNGEEDYSKIIEEIPYGVSILYLMEKGSRLKHDIQ